MDEDNPDTNPLNFLSAEEIILFWRNTDPEQWKYYTGILREQNCFNPLIAAYIKRLGAMDRYTLIGLNSTYFCRLHFIRKGALKKEPGRALHALETLWKALQKAGIAFSDFVEFKGIFSECRWIWRTAPDSEPIHDVIFNGDLFDGWTEFIQPGNAPKDALIELFGDIINIKTEEMGALGFKNPLAQIIQNKIEPDTFANAKNKWFLALFRSQKAAEENSLKNKAAQKEDVGISTPSVSRATHARTWEMIPNLFSDKKSLCYKFFNTGKKSGDGKRSAILVTEELIAYLQTAVKKRVSLLVTAPQTTQEFIALYQAIKPQNPQ